MPDSPTLAILGAGAAGLMAACTAAGAGARVVVLEGSADGGRKILISGGGRACCRHGWRRNASRATPRHSADHYAAASMRRALAPGSAPSPSRAETGEFLHRAQDVHDSSLEWLPPRRAALREPAGHGVEPGPAASRSTAGGASLSGASAADHHHGGLSVPATGSDGFGLALARRLGHEVHATYPALTPLTAEPPVHAALAGVSLAVTLRAPGHKGAEATGGFLFTHRGYSGPAVLDLSHHAVRSRLGGGARQPLLVQWGALDAEAWDALLQQRSAAGVLGLLRDRLPARLAERLLEEAGVAPACQLAQLKREDRRALVERLTRYPLPWTGDEGYKKAEVTGGGVALGEVDPGTLESRRVPGLYFAGEVLDAFGPIGGHNFAWAWATGRLAGLGAAKRTGRAD